MKGIDFIPRNRNGDHAPPPRYPAARIPLLGTRQPLRHFGQDHMELVGRARGAVYEDRFSTLTAAPPSSRSEPVGSSNMRPSCAR